MTCVRCTTPGSKFAGECTCPLICTCQVAVPEPCGQCHHCLRPVVQLWPPDAYSAALMAYPQICAQQVDWTLRKVSV